MAKLSRTKTEIVEALDAESAYSTCVVILDLYGRRLSGIHGVKTAAEFVESWRPEGTREVVREIETKGVDGTTFKEARIEFETYQRHCTADETAALSQLSNEAAAKAADLCDLADHFSLAAQRLAIAAMAGQRAWESAAKAWDKANDSKTQKAAEMARKRELEPFVNMAAAVGADIAKAAFDLAVKQGRASGEWSEVSALLK